MVYPFKTDTTKSTTTLGISHLPYTTTEHKLEGLSVKDGQVTKDNIKFAYCSSINSKYAQSPLTLGGIHRISVTQIGTSTLVQLT